VGGVTGIDGTVVQVAIYYGRAVEVGDHGSLMAKADAYAKIFSALAEDRDSRLCG
jgi:hypothetical protein